jgi:hypothetical protein
VPDEDWDKIYKFDYNSKMTPYHQYCFRTGSFHSNVHLHYFHNEDGLESTDIIESRDLMPEYLWDNLADIRDSVAYEAYLALIGVKEDPSTYKKKNHPDPDYRPLNPYK